MDKIQVRKNLLEEKINRENEMTKEYLETLHYFDKINWKTSKWFWTRIKMVNISYIYSNLYLNMIFYLFCSLFFNAFASAAFFEAAVFLCIIFF